MNNLMNNAFALVKISLSLRFIDLKVLPSPSIFPPFSLCIEQLSSFDLWSFLQSSFCYLHFQGVVQPVCSLYFL